MALGTDYDFYGGFGSGGSYGSPGLYQSWQTSGLGSYLGYSSYQPQTSALPATAAGFLQSQIPELSGIQGLGTRLSAGLQEQYANWRGSSAALEAGGGAAFANQLLGNEEIQKLIQEQELAGAGTILGGDVTGAVGLSQFIESQLADESSVIQNIYGGTGAGAGAIERDIRALMEGRESSIGNLTSEQLFGSRGQHTQGSREAVLSRLLGRNLVNFGDQTFNPFSAEAQLLGQEYRVGLGGSDVQGQDLLRTAAGLLATQDLDITQGLAGAIQRGVQTGAAEQAFGGSRSYRGTQAISGLADILGEGAAVQQDDLLRSHIDAWYQGVAGGGFGRGLVDYARQAGLAANQRLAL